MGTSSWRST